MATTLKEIESKYLQQLASLYDPFEAKSVFEYTVEELCGWSKGSLLLHRNKPVEKAQLDRLNLVLSQLKTGMPVQYALHSAWFYGLQFYVDPSVLIPRPETEELVELIVKKCAQKKSLLDIGTGSGCIPIAIKTKLPEMEISALDVSEAALEIARKNARENSVAIHFFKTDILAIGSELAKEKFDVIVSNPPYIPPSEGLEMKANVLDFEPHVALFTPEEDPLLFYKAIAKFAKTNLNAEGVLYFEINRRFSKELKVYLENLGFEKVEVYRDMQGADRMVEARLKKRDNLL